MSLAKRALSGTVAGLASLIAQLALQLVSVPLLLRAWGEQTYGIWLATNSFYALLITLDQGHQNYVGAQLLGSVGVDDADARRATQTGVAGATVLALLEATVAFGLFFAGRIDDAVAAPPERAAEVALAVAILLAAWLATGSVGGVLVRLYAPLGQYARATWIGLGQRVTMAAAALVAAALGGGLVHAALATAGASSVWAVFVLADLARFRQYRPFYTLDVDRRRLWTNLGGSLALTGTGFVAQAQQHVLLLILGSTAVGAGAIAMFATTRTLANLFLQGAATFVAPLAPDLVRSHVEKQPERLGTLLVVLSGVGAAATSLGIAALLPFVTPLYVAWTGHALHFDRTLFALLAASVIARAAASPMLTLLNGTNALRAQFLGAAAQTLVTLSTAATLAPIDGLRGVCLGILLGELAADAIVYPFYTARLQREAFARAPRASAALVLGGIGAAILVLLVRAYTDVPDYGLAAALGCVGVVIATATLRALPDATRTRLQAALPWRRTA